MAYKFTHSWIYALETINIYNNITETKKKKIL